LCATVVSGHDAPLIGERAATCGCSATERGDERAGAKGSEPPGGANGYAPRHVPPTANPPQRAGAEQKMVPMRPLV